MSHGRSKTPTVSSTPLSASNSLDVEQRLIAFERMAQESFRQQQQQQQLREQEHQQQALQNNPMQGQWNQMQLLQQQQVQAQQQAQYDQAAAAAAAQMVGRQGAIKDVRSIIEDYRQRHPESVPRRGRRMKTVPTTNASLILNSSGSNSSNSSCNNSLQLMLMAATQNNSNQSILGLNVEATELVGGGGEGAEVPQVVVDNSNKDASVVAVGGDDGGGNINNLKSEMKKSLNLVSSGGDVEQKPMELKTKTKAVVVTEKGVKQRVQDSDVSRRGREWQPLLNSLSEYGTTATARSAAKSSSTVRSPRPSSAELSKSSSSASAINSILTQHGLLSAISVTSLGASGGGGSSNSGAEGSSGGRGPVTGNSNFLSFSGQFVIIL